MSRVFFKDSDNHKINIKRVQYTVSDSINYEETGVAKRGIKIEVQGWMKREEIKSYLAWSNKGNASLLQRNRKGTLSFIDDMSSDEQGNSYMTVNDVYIVSIEETSETWREWGQVNVAFQNEGMFSGDSIIAKFGTGANTVDIYNVQLNIQPSVIRKNMTTIPHWNGSFYQETGYEVTRIYLNGIIPWDSCSFPESIVSAFELFDKDGDVLIPTEGSIYDFFQDLKPGSGLKIDKIFIESANLTWFVEKKVIQVNVCFVGPHQTVK